jgi:hypothetical protein
MNQVHEESNKELNQEKTFSSETLGHNCEQSSNQIKVESRIESKTSINNQITDKTEVNIKIHQNVEISEKKQNEFNVVVNSHDSSEIMTEAIIDISKTENSLKVSKEISKKEVKKSVSASSSKEIEKELKKSCSISQESIKTDSKHFPATSSLFQVKELEAKKSTTIIKEKGKVELTFNKSTTANILNSKNFNTGSTKSTFLSNSNSKEKGKNSKETSKGINEKNKKNPATKTKETKSESSTQQVVNTQELKNESEVKLDKLDLKEMSENISLKNELDKETKQSASNSKEINIDVADKQEFGESIQLAETRKVSDEIKQISETIEKEIEPIVQEHIKNDSTEQNKHFDITETVEKNQEQFAESQTEVPNSNPQEVNRELNDVKQVNVNQIQAIELDFGKHQGIHEDQNSCKDTVANHVGSVIIPVNYNNILNY